MNKIIYKKVNVNKVLYKTLIITIFFINMRFFFKKNKKNKKK